MSGKKWQKLVRGWFPQEPTYHSNARTQVEKADQVSIKVAFIVYLATFFSIVFPILLLMDFLGVNFVFKTLIGAASAGFAAAVANFLLKRLLRRT
jgi:hypothetical protein